MRAFKPLFINKFIHINMIVSLVEESMLHGYKKSIEINLLGVVRVMKYKKRE